MEGWGGGTPKVEPAVAKPSTLNDAWVFHEDKWWKREQWEARKRLKAKKAAHVAKIEAIQRSKERYKNEAIF